MLISYDTFTFRSTGLVSGVRSFLQDVSASAIKRVKINCLMVMKFIVLKIIVHQTLVPDLDIQWYLQC
ncbi:hypothetical protein D3C87_1667740 [compost metagenome]